MITPWRATARIAWEILRHRPLPFLVLTGFVFVASLRTAIYVRAEGGMVDALFRTDRDAAVYWGGLWIAANVMEEIYWVVKPYLTAIVSDFATHRIQRRVMAKAQAVPLLTLEQGEFHARLQRAADNVGGRISGLLMSLMDVVQTAAMSIGVAIPLFTISPWLVAIMVVGAIPAIVVEGRTAKRRPAAWQKHARNSHLLTRLEAIVSGRDEAAELRLFGSAGVVLQRWQQVRHARGDDVIAANRAVLGGDLAASLFRTLAFSTAVAVALWSITGQSMSIGTWAVVATGMQWMSATVWGAAWSVRNTRENVAYAGDLFAFEAMADRVIAEERRESGAALVRHGGRVRVEVEGLGFRYPASERDVLNDVSFTIEPGETIAIVGENGAGKSTLIRLLTGMYLPTAGSVRLDGVETRSASVADLATRVGVVFQDFQRFPMTLRDNVTLGDVSRDVDDAAVTHALDRAGARDLLATMDEGLDSWLGREFGRRELSGGEWQRVALARAFYRDADLLILDEPTAALDPKAEQALFERFGSLVADRTAIMISHRLASARVADRILVLDGGRLVESGTHDTLLAAGGPYARMWDAQAAWYW